MRKLVSQNISKFIITVTAIYMAYYLLLHDNFLHSSIASIIDSANRLNIKEHLLIVGLLPIYIAMMIFGAALAGVYLGSKLQLLFDRYPIQNILWLNTKISD
ncbi:hypothetical protein [Aquicella lusitana]|uniref:Uncharacterized protein n=1 Tax=Aquicella lusitana TaxID=254246 RepID=A0A370GFH0_9COXI|nr:hypothetical protein [Aquicella lusitana]RDI42411.1 hypothetical protein C8D86_11514 [Aquicella lusitana]VVC74127.1 hypothetical protein AQULUS_18920 [Aquicella lusitana]